MYLAQPAIVGGFGPWREAIDKVESFGAPAHRCSPERAARRRSRADHRRDPAYLNEAEELLATRTPPSTSSTRRSRAIRSTSAGRSCGSGRVSSTVRASTPIRTSARSSSPRGSDAAGRDIAPSLDRPAGYGGQARLNAVPGRDQAESRHGSLGQSRVDDLALPGRARRRPARDRVRRTRSRRDLPADPGPRPRRRRCAPRRRDGGGHRSPRETNADAGRRRSIRPRTPRADPATVTRCDTARRSPRGPDGDRATDHPDEGTEQAATARDPGAAPAGTTSTR